MHQALSAVRDKIGLSVAPMAQCRSPLPGPLKIEELLTDTDHGAVGEAGNQRRHFAACDTDQGLPVTHPPQRQQVAVTEAVAYLRGLSEDVAGGIAIAARQGLQCARKEQEAILRAAGLGALDQSLGPREPAPGAGHLARDDQLESQPERAPGSASGIVTRHPHVERASPRVLALAVFA